MNFTHSKRYALGQILVVKRNPSVDGNFSAWGGRDLNREIAFLQPYINAAAAKIDKSKDISRKFAAIILNF